jgi:formylglycine-generating enzyme required for sulfatase activity
MVSQAWSRPAIYTLLEQWSQKGIVNILQLLPKRLWSRSVLGQQQYLKLNSLPLSPNKICNFPVVSLESETLDNWINLLKGIVNNQADGYLLIYPELPPIDTAPLPHPQQRVKDFQIISSATALRLAEYLSTTLVTLPVIRVIQYTMLPPSNPSHVAEVLMGGLFKPLDETITPHIDPDEIEFYFHEGIREELLTCLTIDEITLVMETASAYIAQKMGKTQREFEALLVSPQARYQQDSLAQQIYPLAQIQAEILSKLGGQYTQYAEAIYEAQEFQEIRWANDSLQPLSVDIPTLTFPETEELPKLQFTTVFVNSRGERIREEEGEAYYYDEALGEESLRMIYIPAREFLMGTEGKERERLKNKGHSWVDREMPSHLVKVPAFYLSQTPITQGQWKEVAIKIERVIIRLEPELAYYKKDPPNTRLKKGEKAKTRWDDRPVEQVSWEEAVEFCQRLTKLTGRAYQLPSEAQWEYACRAGTITPFHFGETLTLDLANYNGNRTFADESKGKYRGETTPVGQFPPNGFGLYDMHGNVWEWCKDDYHPNYEGNPPLDGSAWSEGDSGTKILRGGSWDNNPEYCRSAIRSNYYRDVRGSYYGFRVMCWSRRT